MAPPKDDCGDTLPSFSLWHRLQKASLLLALPFVVAVGVFRENKGRSWRRAARIASLRYLLGKVQNALDFKIGCGVTTAEVYAMWARKSGADVLTDELSEGAMLHWIGPRREDRVFLFLHGGGYVMPARVDYFYMLEALHKEYKGAVGIAMLNYSLVPEYPFPKQLCQTIAAIQHLLDLGVSPSNIIIGGDSAGGNLALQLASQLLQPHPSLPTLRIPSHASTETDSEFPEPFGGMLLISPWLEYNVDAPSFARNSTRDVLPLNAWQVCADIVRQGIVPALHNHLEPGIAPDGWWKGLGGVFPRVLITAGEYEGIVDSIQRTGAVIAEEVKDTTVFVLPGGVHEDFIEAFASGEGEKGDDYKLVVSWLSASLEL
ncbi:Alpha/Beta hydrolase protein [Russula aff. rugulosa BPL654]|nr:Alpha/Beta hydrolase protein [Russula aff. rugulosa BPL654]